MTQSPKNVSKGFTKAFWVSNTVELFERMAYYAVFIVLTIYLSSILGFNDLEASMISGLFSGGLYLLPIFTGAYADKIGFRKSMIVAFSLLSVGYLGLGILPTLLEAAGLVEYGKATRFTGLPDSDSRWMIVPVLFVIMVGGALCIQGMVEGVVGWFGESTFLEQLQLSVDTKFVSDIMLAKVLEIKESTWQQLQGVVDAVKSIPVGLRFLLGLAAVIGCGFCEHYCADGNSLF